jgi:hypothetical protein
MNKTFSSVYFPTTPYGDAKVYYVVGEAKDKEEEENLKQLASSLAPIALNALKEVKKENGIEDDDDIEDEEGQVK